jgi:hypothetical protein
MVFRRTGTRAGTRAGISLTLLLAFLLPLVVGLLPAPTAEAQLARDIAASLCDPQGDGPAKTPHDDHKSCCILCPAGTFAALTTRDVPPDPAPGEVAGLWTAYVREAAASVRRLDLAHIAPRGPPAA